MTNPRTEAVAKAMHEAEREQMGAGAPWERLMTTPKSRWMVRAQAAEKALIEALMEPSEAMIKVGMGEIGPQAPIVMVSDIYTAMLKAAGGDDAA